MRIPEAAERQEAGEGSRAEGEAVARFHLAEAAVALPAAGAVCQTLERMVPGESPS